MCCFSSKSVLHGEIAMHGVSPMANEFGSTRLKGAIFSALLKNSLKVVRPRVELDATFLPDRVLAEGVE